MLGLRLFLNGRKPEWTDTQMQQLSREFQTMDMVQQEHCTFYVTKGIERKEINPEILLPYTIAEAKSTEALVLTSICLRGGASPNMYITTPETGRTHLMVYAATLMKNNRPLLNTVCTVLRLLGTSVALPAYTPPMLSAPGEVVDVSVINAIVGATPPPVQTNFRESVLDWLTRNGLDLFAGPIEVIMSKFDPDSRIVIATVCDNVDYAFPSAETQAKHPNIDHIVLCRPPKVMARYATLPATRGRMYIRGQPYGLEVCINGVYSQFYQALVENGVTPNYFTVNKLVLMIKSAYQDSDVLLVNEYSAMFRITIDYGTAIDSAQLAMVADASVDLADATVKVYSKPLWQKACRGVNQNKEANLPNSLRRLAVSLGITAMTTEAACQQLESIALADPAALKEAALARQRARLNSTVSTVSDFTEGTVPTLACKNNTSRGGNPLDYVDASLAFYKDSQGQVWCYTADTFRQLLAHPFNPSTQEPLPPTFIAQIKEQLEVLKQMGLEEVPPLSFSEALEALQVPDKVDNRDTQFVVGTINRAFAAEGLPIDRIKALTPAQMNEILRSIGMDQPYLAQLAPEHRYITFAQALYLSTRRDPQTAQIFMNRLRAELQMPIATSNVAFTASPTLGVGRVVPSPGVAFSASPNQPVTVTSNAPVAVATASPTVVTTSSPTRFTP